MISNNFNHLVKLLVTYNEITADGMMSLTDSNFFHNLEYLDMQENEISDVGVQIIATCSMKNLKFMNIRHNKIRDEGYKCIADGENMPLLQTLQIYPGNEASMEAKKSLMRSRYLRCLSSVS